MEKICPVCGEKLTHNNKVNKTDYVCPYCYSKFEIIENEPKKGKAGNKKC